MAAAWDRKATFYRPGVDPDIEKNRQKTNGRAQTCSRRSSNRRINIAPALAVALAVALSSIILRVNRLKDNQGSGGLFHNYTMNPLTTPAV